MHVRQLRRTLTDRDLLRTHLRLALGPCARTPEEWRDLFIADRRLLVTFRAVTELLEGGARC